MLVERRAEDPDRREWLNRTLFTSGEEPLATPLIGLSMIPLLLTKAATLDQVVELVDHFGKRLNQQISLIDMSEPDPAKSRFLICGAYRTGMVGDGGSVLDIPNAVQRRQAIEDYFMARTLGRPLFSKIEGWMQGRSWRYDRLLIPIQNKRLNLLVSAFWHSGEPSELVRPVAAPSSAVSASVSLGQRPSE